MSHSQQGVDFLSAGEAGPAAQALLAVFAQLCLLLGRAAVGTPGSTWSS